MEQHDENAIIVYTDGSCLQRPRRGGFAYRYVTIDAAGEEETIDFNPPGYLNATNNEMELLACVEALKHLAGRPPVPRSSYEKVVIYTDSMYVLNGINPAQFTWPANGWLTREGEPVLSPDLWKDLVRQKQAAGRVEFRRVAAHKTNPHNKAVDALAKESARAAVPPRLPGRKMLAPREVRRKSSIRKTEPRAVAMRGQVETIKIIVLRQISGRPHHAYKYEVVAEGSEDVGAVDEAFGEDGRVEMRAGHVYRVRFRGAGTGRWIDEIIEELERT
jgi:ribonuclease HI